VPGRRLDDDARVMLRYANGARGLLWASQVAVGNENELKLRVYGTKGGIEWSQRDANQLAWTPLGGNRQVVTRGGPGANAASRRVSRIPAGHPEGYLAGFATIYAEVAEAILAARGGKAAPADVLFPTVADGVKGLAFVEAAVRSWQGGAAWTRFAPFC